MLTKSPHVESKDALILDFLKEAKGTPILRERVTAFDIQHYGGSFRLKYVNAIKDMVCNRIRT